MASIKLPSLIRVYDYHEFNSVVDVLAQFGTRIKFEEVGCDQAGNYMAVFYNTSKKDPKVKKLILQGKKLSQYEDENSDMFE